VEDSGILSASEFAFLAIGLVLGVASGAALIEVLRARPPVSRSVRVTVAPNAIQARRPSTLADPLAVGDPVGPARGGPGDRRWRDDIVVTGEPAATGRRTEDRTARLAGSGEDRTPVRSSIAIDEPPRPAPLRLQPAGAGPATGLVAVPMSLEPDPMTTAIRSSALAGATSGSVTGWVATLDRPTPTAAPSPEASRTAERSAPEAPASDGRGPGGTPTGDGAPSPSGAGAPTGAGAESSTDAPSSPAPTADGPCAEERRVADERCAVATRAREQAAVAAENLRRTQRTYDDFASRAEASAAAADPRAVRSAKELAQQRFRDARTGAQTRDDIEAGARAWLAEINRINHDTREASLGLERDRAAALALGPTLERLHVEADAARISAERADEACVLAREAVANCDEARTVEDAARRTGGDAPAEEPAGPIPADDEPGRIAAATPEPADEFAFSTPMNSQAGQDALILRILRGDREAMQRAVARLGGDDPEARQRWQLQLGGLAEALIARAIEATAFDFPIDHPFWGPFNQSQGRDIAAGLSSLGYRFDGFGGWVDDHMPSQRDLSLAVGYAGLDPMRVRRWPNEAETRDLLQDVRVAADEYVAGAAGGLTLGELVTLLGRRADGLTELWNQWGSARPILLEAS
jgi:hypothetical protein